jgi:hypothetical protein
MGFAPLLSVSLPIPVVVLKDCVTETNDAA